MTEKIKIGDGNILIYVVELTGLHYGVSFFVLEVEELKKTYRTIRAYEYAGRGLVKETSTHIVSQFYKKSNKSVFTDFEAARNFAIEKIERMIERCKEEVKQNVEKLTNWKN